MIEELFCSLFSNLCRMNMNYMAVNFCGKIKQSNTTMGSVVNIENFISGQ